VRTSHFPELRISALFVSGSKDSFATIQELEAAIELIPARTELVPIDGASHGLAKPGNAAAIASKIKEKFLEFFA
jgi:predicted alpha/beta-hydrolase family hydrolase